MKENPEKREYWQRRIEAWKSSGLSRRLYCEQNGIRVSTLDYWCQNLSPSRKDIETGKASWIPLPIDKDESFLKD